MSKYLEYYQFHEKDEDGNIVCLYCIVKRTDDGICLQFEKDYNTALKELEEFAYDNEIYTTEELKNSSKLHLQVSNKEFREELAKKYGYKTDEINNFNEASGISLIVPLDDNKINYEEIIDSNPSKRTTSTNDGDENTEEEKEEVADSEEEKSHPIIEKLKKLKIKGIKKLAIRSGIIVSALILGFTGIKGCTKKGTTKDLKAEDYTIDPQMIEAENEAKAADNNQETTDDVTTDDIQDPIDLQDNNSSSDFQTYLNQSSEVTKNYMTDFKNNLSAFNGVARNYIDTSKNSRLGLDTNNYTAFQMALLGSGFGSYVDNVSSYWYHEDLYQDYVKTNDQLKQLATVQKQSAGLANALKGEERQEFYNKYENMIIDLNKTTDIEEKQSKAEDILSQIKKDFNMDSENYNPEELLRSDSKYIAVMPMVRSVYDRAKDSNYENTPSADKMKQLSLAYRKVVSDNLLNALDSIEVKSSITPSYEMYMDEIGKLLDSVDLYVIDDERNIRDTELYKQSKKLPAKEIKVTPTSTSIPTLTPTLAPTPVGNSNVDVETIENTGAAEVDIPVYTTDDDNFEYQEDTNDSVQDETTDSITDNTVSSPSIADQIIESDEGTTEENTNDNDNNTNDTITDDNQIVESEEDIANSMNDTINNGGYAETPDGWQIDDQYKQDGTNIIDGSVSDITIDDSNGSEEVPTTSEDTTNNDYGVTESEEDYAAPAIDNEPETTTDEENTVTEEVPTYSTDTTESEPVYDEPSSSTDTEPTNQEEAPVYETEEPVLEASANQTKAGLTQEQTIDQVISYNTNGINAIPVFNASDNSWSVEVVDTGTKEVQPMQYNM